jgi:hypothetical protein
MTKVLAVRFVELTKQLEEVELTKRYQHGENLPIKGDYVDEEKFLNWRVKAKNLLVRACGSASEHFRIFEEEEKTGLLTNYQKLKRLKAVFLAAREDFEGGYLLSVRGLVQAEVFDSELEQATELLANNYVAAAAVIAGVVLETSLRELCQRHGLSTGKLDTMNSALAGAGVYHKLTQKRITALADIRNNAAHGHPEKFTGEDVKGMITEVERFVGEHTQ